MRAQRVREAESRIEMQITKWTAEGIVKGQLGLVFYDVRPTSEVGDMMVSLKGMGFSIKQGGTAGELYSSLIEEIYQGRFLFGERYDEGRN